MYDPTLGRWWQIDQIDKEDLSPYSWVTNNPLLYADPFGLDSINYDDLPVTPFDPENDVVILDEVEVAETYTGPKAEDSPNVQYAMLQEQRGYWFNHGPAPGIAEFDPMTQLSLGFLAGSIVKTVTPLLTSTTTRGSTILNIIKPNGKLIGVQVGNNPAIRTVTKAEAENIVKELISSGAKTVPKPGYPGTWYQLPSGGGFGVRTVVSQQSVRLGSTSAIDLNIPGIALKNLKF